LRVREKKKETDRQRKRKERNKKEKKMNGIKYHVIVPNLFSALLSLQNKLACFSPTSLFSLILAIIFDEARGKRPLKVR
jgi:hypothetical protein